MSNDDASDTMFGGSVAEIYERHLVPLIFQPYAADLADRATRLPLTSLLEIAAGTGVVTRALAAALPESVAITATDLSVAMIEQARVVGTSRPVTWRAADVMQLPFDTGTFDAVVCQFGVMFFPDRPAAYAEVARVLKPGGVFLFNAWNAIEHNEFADVVTAAVRACFPDNSPQFVARIPHGYFDTAQILRDLDAGGFGSSAVVERVDAFSRASTADVPAIAFCEGTPLRHEIEACGEPSLAQVTEAAAAAVARRFGPTDIEGAMSAFVVTAIRP